MLALHSEKAHGGSRGGSLLPWRLFSRLTIAGKMFAGYLVLAVLILSVVIYVLISLSRINSLNRSIVTIDIPVQAATDEMIDALLAQNLYEKRYLVLRRKDLRHLFWERAKEFEALLDGLADLPGEAEVPFRRIARLHAQYGDLFLAMTKKVQAGRTSDAEAASSGPMKEVVDELFGLLTTVRPRARAVQEARMRQISEASATAFRTTVRLCIISMAVGALAGLAVTFYISFSLRRLRAATDRIAGGEFETGLLTRAEDEIGDLYRAFDAMGRQLKKHEEMYLDASPLTRLPGGIAIERDVQRRIDDQAPLAFCVMDLDNFKAFNDRYGYALGNEVIKETARIVERSSRTHGAPDDFVGHVGGDDFVVVTRPDAVHALCGEIIAQFDRRIPLLYSEEDRKKGYIRGKTRQGVAMKFPLMTISIAVVTNAQRAFSSPLEASEVAAELKDYAKTFNRSLFVIDKRRI